MATRIRTLNFLPEIFKTPTNKQFLSATLDQLVSQPSLKKIEGYVGSKFGYGINAKDYYVVEPTKIRTDYQLEPGVVFKKTNESVAQDFISYPGIIDALKLEGGLTKNNNRLFNSEFYSWDSFTDLDKIINYNQYYWIPTGPDRVIVSSETVFSETDYSVYDYPNGYNIVPVSSGVAAGSTNPTLTLLRGGTYNFNVNQDTQFWIQGEPGVTGFSATQPNLQTRDVYGVDNNGANIGVVTFFVPQKDAQDQYNFPGNNLVDLISTVPFSQLNGQPASSFSVDGISSLNGLTVLFYNTGVPNEVGYVSNFYDYSPYDQNTGLNSILSVSVTATASINNAITCNTTNNLVAGNTITFTGVPFGGLNQYSTTLPNTIYYIKSILSTTEFTVSLTLDGPEVTLSNGSGSLVGNINQGQYEEGFYTNVDENFYTIQYIGTEDNYVIRLVPTTAIPINQKITARFGTQYGLRDFYKNTFGDINIIPYLSAQLDTLYYQDGTSNNKVGIIKLVDSNETNTLDVENEILGKKTFTSTNGVVFTNGLKVSFQGDVIPESYADGEYYVEGVGSSINLIPTSDLVCPEDYTESVYTPWDIFPWDIGAWEGSTNIPVTPDYITISRNSFDQNAWSRSNRWFHIDVINATAQYNNTPDIITQYTNINYKAKRPIIEFYGNLKLFESGTQGKPPVDFIDTRTTDAFTEVAGQENYYPDVTAYTSNSVTINGVTGTSTTLTVLASNVTGTLQVGQYVADNFNVLPNNSQITQITGGSTLTITVTWPGTHTVSAMADASIISTDTTVDNYALFEGSTIIFANDENENIKNKIFVSRFAVINGSSTPVITLSEVPYGIVLPNQQTVITRGYNYRGKQFYFNGVEWKEGQTKIDVNQPPLFDILDSNNISFGDKEIYVGTSFAGCKLFSYGIGSGLDDAILGFPIKYSSVDNVGDINFDVSLNTDTFNYVNGSNPVTQQVNTGYVHLYSSRTEYDRQLGWQTAVSPSIQYQVFQFEYDALSPVSSYVCDIAPVDSASTNWPVIQVYFNNVIQSDTDYTVNVTTNSTTITISSLPVENTVIQILIFSDQVSEAAYFTVPINLNNNPLNADITTANLGDIRGQYQSIFENNPNTSGNVFGPNNYRDLGNMVPWGNRIIQNSASLALPGTFLRKQEHNLLNSLLFNSREYIKFKSLLMDVVNNSDYQQRYDASFMLDDALSQITASKTENQPFFWSDMVPSKAAVASNTYTFVNSLDVSVYPLTKIYDFSKANYNGVLVYLTRVVNNIPVTKQLIINQDYVVSTNSPSLTITLDLFPGDVINIKEYNQTYGSYVPNTPTKLGMYSAYIPKVVLDSDYTVPTYFIRGHDGSYTKLYGQYDSINDVLIDFRDQVLLEYETRVYNNLKISSPIPINEYELVPGYFRETDYSNQEWLLMYSANFLNWVGQNRINYKKQVFNSNDEFTYNYSQSGNALNKAIIDQGYWRGIYQYFYDTTTPNTSPWEMLGFIDQPDWWAATYGAAPYTSDNLILWSDLENGIIRQGPRENFSDNQYQNDSNLFARPGLTKIIPVDSAGNLKSPMYSVIGAYNSNIFRRDWKIGDVAPVELSYRRSSTYPFDLIKLMALSKPAEFYNLAVDLDNYKYNTEFGQYLVGDRRHLIISDIEIYGNGTAKTSYINWIVDYEKQTGVDATQNISTLLNNLDVRLIYRLAGFSDKNLLKFYVEKGTPNSRNSSLLIPDESYSVLLYDNQPFNRIVYSSVIVQKTNEGYTVYGNSQTSAYFKTLKPKLNENYKNLTVENVTVKLASAFYPTEEVIPYGYTFYNLQDLSQFLINYGAYLETQGVVFDQQENELTVDWYQMVSEFMYWAQTGWEVGSITTLNPGAKFLKIDKDSNIVQPLTFQKLNFVLNQNLYPIQIKDLSILREGTSFSLQALNEGDTISYGQFNISNFEHAIVFDNVTLFNDVIYNLTTGLRQNRILLRGNKSAEWNGTVDAGGFILNQDNVEEWNKTIKYTKGSIVKYKNKYYTALQIIQPKETFAQQEQYWKRTEYDEIQKGLLPNASTRAYESTLYYDCNQANLEKDADLLGFSLIGYRPRDYMALSDLTDITQINVYKNMIKNKGTRNAASAFKGANLPQGGIDYDIYENWAILSGEFGGVLNNNFVEFKLNENYLTGNPATVELTDGYVNESVQQQVPLYSLYNYTRQPTNSDILSTLPSESPSVVYPTAGYVNYTDVKMASYFYSDLPLATNSNGKIIPLTDFYVRDYLWLAEYLGDWQVYAPESIGQVVNVRNNLNDTITVTFNKPHNLSQYNPFAIVNFDTLINGYYIASIIVDPYRVIVPFALNPNITELTGLGIGLKFSDQRVEKPSDIDTLPLLNSEFRKNTVWVDENNNGSWAVYRKGINYNFDEGFTKQNSQSYGSSVAYTNKLGYLIGDNDLGQVYRYTYNDLFKGYQLIQTLTSGSSFGSAISYSDDIFVISEPTGTPKVHIYQLEQTALSDDLAVYQTAISAPGGVTNWGSSTAISGDKKWLYISDIDNNTIHVYRKSELTGNYVVATTIDADALSLTTAGDQFGYSISTDYYGDTLIVGAPKQNYSVSISDYGYSYVFNRSTQNFETQYTNTSSDQIFDLAWSHPTLSKTVTATISGYITLNNVTSVSINDPVIFTSTGGAGLSGTNVETEKVYYVAGFSGSSISLKTSRTGSPISIAIVGSISNVTCTVQNNPLYVNVNGTSVSDNNYAVVGAKLYFTSMLNAGDIVNVSGQQFTLIQTLTTQNTPQIGVNFGLSVDTTTHGTEVIVGAPFQLNTQLNEGAVYRYTNGGGKYGIITGTNEVNVTMVRTLLLNGYAVTIPVGNASVAANAINTAKITNIVATASANKLIISLVDNNLAPVNEKLLLSVVDTTTLIELGIDVYTQTQIVTCPHSQGRTQFGTVVKFNEFNSFVASAPVGTRYVSTTFDFTDNENQDDDTIFDNNATQWVDEYENAGAVYMFDYLDVYNESLSNTGKFIYAQSINARNENYGSQPRYGTAIDFNNYHVIVSAPDNSTGLAVAYENVLGQKDWSVFRSSSKVVDIERVGPIQIFDIETNSTLINLDYIDPWQGKILGAARENIDFVSNQDPAKYNNTSATIHNGLIWGASNIGQIWFDTSNVRFMNYHQNDVTYNSKYWGTLFPGSDAAIYTWISSNVIPSAYQGIGTPYSFDSYAIQYGVNDSGSITPTYYYWVRNTNLIFTNQGKTLSDNVIANYISNPQASGISYFAPLLPNTFALYNCGTYINDLNSVLHLGFSTGTTNELSHTSYDLIRENYPDDFLPGLPDPFRNIQEPFSLYARMLDSLSGTDRSGAVVPDPYLPKAVQLGVLVRPRQSFFIDRLGALKNYIQYANEVASELPLLEILNSNFLFKASEFYNTTDYWEAINWWAPGYNDSTRSSVQVPEYSYLSSLSVADGTIATVETNGAGLSETYILRGESWTRIGLKNGTLRIKDSLYDYEAYRIGFGDNFFDTTPYDQYPSEETNYIVRALNEELPTSLLDFRNKGLILLFQYIQSETIESQNYLPWLNKTSLVDVAHTIRELKPIEQFKTDNQDFLAGYLNEVKPYHVVIKEFLFKYTGSDIFEGDVTDFDLPAKFNSSTQTFITPEIVYTDPSTPNQYQPTNPIWSQPEYKQWKENYGVSFTGQQDVLMTTLQSYLTLNSDECLVDNAQGFPINGIIRIEDELIGYSSVDRALNILTGLTRGVNGTTVSTHIPGKNIIMDLPPVILLNSGRGYTEPPKVIAYIDTTIYPPPTRPAVLSAVMNLDNVLRVDVIDPGLGYAVSPEVIIDSANSVTFTSDDVDTLSNTIELYAPLLQTGDLIQYKIGPNSDPIAGLKNNEWYYVNLLETVPAVVIGLYTNYSTAILDHDRVKLYSVGSGTYTVNSGARAISISTASPIRENTVSLRFDRTTYYSDVIDWIAGKYYGAYYAGTYSNSENFSSSSIQLFETQPPIDSILGSNGGIPFEINSITNDRELTFSSTIRTITGTSSVGNVITLNPSETTPNAAGSTLGFYIGMPIKFIGNAGSSSIVVENVYYVNSILNDTQFTISSNSTGSPVFALNTYTVGTGAPLTCYTGEVIDTAIITANYPGIMSVTNTQSVTNKLTIPLNASGTGGTNNFYIDLPVFFTGDVYGGVVANQTYYVTTVVDQETFTMSKTPNPQTFTVVSVNGLTDEIIIDGDTANLNINEPIIFNTMVIAGVESLTFGGLVSGQTYYVSAITSGTAFKVSLFINGAVENLSTVTSAVNTSALVTSQKNTVSLSSGTGSNMVINVSLPVSPGQVNGQQFTFYETSEQFVGLTATNTSLITRTISSVISTPSTLAGIMTFDVYGDNLDNFYVNMPFKVSSNIGLLTTVPVYYVKSIGVVEFETTYSSSTTNELTCDTVEQLYVGMPIVFTGSAFGNIVIGVQYFVKTINTGTNKITISETKTGGVVGSTFVLSTTSGSMNGTGDQYIELSTSLGGSAIDPGSNVPSSVITLNQNPIGIPEFSASYILGGYRVSVTNSGSYSGYAINNQLKITGNNIGGETPINDLIMTVDSITSDGEITNLICSGNTPGQVNQYYLKVISPTQFEVYQNSNMTIPVSGIGFPYTGITSSIVTGVTASNDRLTVDDSSLFNLYDPIVFTGTVFGGIVLGHTYYIKSIPNATAITISTVPGGTTLDILSDLSGNMLMTKLGSVAFLPEPFFFDQSIVKYNNNLWACVISNNDSEFIFGKWELLSSGDRRLNALDRIQGYYRPDESNTAAWEQYINMPGDITQLVSGITYPNNTYMGNKFAPGQQYPLDTILTDTPFYPTEVDVQSVLWNGSDYLASVNTNQYSGLILSENASAWAIGKLATSNVDMTDIVYAGNNYVVTTNNTATPIYRSDDGIVWTTSGLSNAVSISPCALNSVAYNNIYVAVGTCITTSTDTFNWVQKLVFPKYLTNVLYGVKYVSIPSYQGFVAVGKGQTLINEGGIGVTYDINLIYTSTDGNSWNSVSPITNKGLFGLTNDSSKIIAVGEDGVIYSSTNGQNWAGINETTVLSVNASTNELNISNASGLSIGSQVRFTNAFNVFNTTTTYYVVNIISNTQIKLSTTSGGLPVTLTSANPNTTTYMYVYPRTATLRDIVYANSKFVTVGDSGLIRTSTNGITWTTVASGISENLNGLNFNADDNQWIAVGDNNTILVSNDNGATWTTSSLLITEPTIYDVQGADFEFGYGPEEMIPGVVKDNLTMTVATRPGTNWPDTEYEHVGYGVKSLELTPTSGTQTVYSFLYATQTPIQLAVYVINGSTGLATRIYQPSYSVDWMNSSITLATPLAFSPIVDKLKIDIYEVGNGDQLVKANSFTDPIRDNIVSGLKETYVNCNYSGATYIGGGIIKPFTYPIQVEATETDSTNNTILCEDVSNLVLNSQIKFQGTVFGGILEDYPYYVKSISVATNRITISTSITSGIAGPVVSVTDASGSMYVVQQIGTGLVYTDPVVYCNGNKLEMGLYGLVLGTSGTNNSVKVNTTSTMIVGQQIVFGNTISEMGPEITPLIPYTILSILDNNEIILEDPLNPGNALNLPDWDGGAEYVTNDYGFGYQPNEIQAKIVYATQYDQTTDYLVYSLFGETQPIQYGYTLPETQLITSNGTVGPYNLTNYVGGDNILNAVVEINGVRLTPATYTINFGTSQITFVSAPTLGSTIAVTSYNLPDRQYFDTNTFTGKTVSNIVDISNTITPYIATVNITNTTTGTNAITCSSTTGFIVNSTIIFKGTGFGGIGTGNQVYFIASIIDSTNFTIKDANGATISLTTASGLMLAYIGGTPAIRVTTGNQHNLTTNNVVRIDGVNGSVQLNNNVYYARVIDNNRFDLYTQPYDSTLGATNYPVVAVSSYISGGYTWLDESFILRNSAATSTSSVNNRITVASTALLIEGTPIYFTESGYALGETIMGGIVAGETYYVREVISVTEFTISATRYGDVFVLSTDSGTMTICQWEQINVDRLWVTVNGYRVPSSKLRINPSNYISILTTISSADTVLITYMVPSATPNEEVYMLNINTTSEPSVYRANNQTRTWLTKSLYNTEDIIYVHDVSRVTNVKTQNAVTPTSIDGVFSIGLLADKDIITNVKVYNTNPSRLGYIDSSNYEVVVESLSPVLKITDGNYIDSADVLVITVLEGNLIYINGEQIKFKLVDTANNTLSGLQRGSNTTGYAPIHEKYSEVFSVLSDNRITDVQYGLTWNSNTYNSTLGDPLQISTTATGMFLNQDIN